MKNKRGQSIFFILMIGVVFFILGLAFAPAIHQSVNEVTNTAELNCSNTSISDQNKAVCTQLDATGFLWTGVIFGLAGMILVGGIIR